MIMTARRLRSMGWLATLVVCATLVMVLAFRVNALRSQVHQSQARIIALKQETMYLETEFETRANQQQLKAWNDVEFGYTAPTASQYLDNERQLAAYAKPVEPDAPAPIRVASADDSVAAAAVFPAMVSPLTGKPVAESDSTAPAATKAHDDGDAAPARGLTGLSDRLATVPHAGVAHKGTKAKDAKAKSAKAVAAHAAQTRDHPGAKAHLASAAAGHGADSAHHPGPGRHAGSSLITLALKDAKTVK
jgi:hypothetical protein